MVILGAAFTINFAACGIIFGFGIYQALYEQMALEQGTPFTGASPAQIDLIGTLSTALMTISAPYAVSWAKYFGPRLVVCSGGVVFGLACVLASFGQQLWHFQLSQGLLLGIGASLSFLPSMTVAPTWFDKHRGIAMGIVSSGTGFGGLVWAPVIKACIQHLGFRNTLRLTGTLGTALILAAGSALTWEPSMAAYLHAERNSTDRVKSLIKITLPAWKTARQRAFIALALGAAFQSAAYYTPVFFIASYARTLGYSDNDGANLIAVSNGCNAIGKITVGFVADRIGRLNSFSLTTLVSFSVTVGLWMSSTLVNPSLPPSSEEQQQQQQQQSLARSLFISFTVLYGLFASAYVSLFPPVLVEVFGLKELPRITGVMYLMQGIGTIIGTPVAGLLIRQGQHGERTPRDYLGSTILISALLFSATVAAAWVRLETMMTMTMMESSSTSAKRRWKWAWKWKL